MKSNKLKIYLSIFLVWIAVFTVIVFIVYKIEKNQQMSIELIQKSLLQEAVAHFDNILVTRKWNASHGGIFVLKNDNLSPNPYLKDNTLKTDDNQTLIKVNPAWMTRQISTIANKDNHYYFKITSLLPINPNNKADAFEKEALEFFEKNKNVKHYYSFSKDAEEIDKFNFMGSLSVDNSCMKCHADQGYSLGDIRGGIRVSVPKNNYINSLKLIDSDSAFSKNITFLFTFIIGLILSIYFKKSLTHTLEIEELNNELEKKVQDRTQKLQEMNETLEDRVQEELQKNIQKDEAMLTKSRYVAMGEMMEMLAHQWRQPIATIEMISSNILVDIELQELKIEELTGGLEGISTETQKLSQIISSFVPLFENDSLKNKLKVESILEDALSVLSGSFQTYNIVVEKNYNSTSEIEIVSQKLFQVYWNILNNSKEIFLERNIQHPKITIDIRETDTEIITQISDNAGGIQSENLEQVFEPYYTTSKNLNGKGLGLYISNNIVQKDLQGSLSVKNSEVGADFIISLEK